LREDGLPATVFVSGGLVVRREYEARPFERRILTPSRQAAKKTADGEGGTTKGTKHTKGCLKAGTPSGIHLPPSFVVKNIEQEHAEKEWDGGRDGVRSTTASTFAALRLCVRIVFLRRCSFQAGSSYDESTKHDPSTEAFSRQAAKAQRRPQMGRGIPRRARTRLAVQGADGGVVFPSKVRMEAAEQYSGVRIQNDL
jgi:hypothetical protein